MSGYTVRKRNAVDNLNTTQTISATLQNLTTQTASQQAQVKELQGQIQSTKAQISDIQLATETYEKDFLDKKSVYSGPRRIQTLQDGVLAFFFISYIILAVVVALLQYRATKQATVAATYLGGFFFFGILLVEIIRRYA